MIDITPVALPLRSPFLPHPGSATEFDGLKQNYQLGIVRVYDAVASRAQHRTTYLTQP
jgi:hypothetical protein